MKRSGVGAVLGELLDDPITHIVRRWNWKAAVLSAMSRALLFLIVNLPEGRRAAFAAFVTELVFRGATSGFYAAVTQALGRAEPVWAAAVTGMLLLPVLTHSAELAVHWLRGTPRLGESILASAAFTALSTAFHLFAMRRGVLIVGDARRPFADALRRLPGLVVAAAIVGGTVGRLLRSSRRRLLGAGAVRL
jgi:Mn2+/Fe2+ NRAMP family transporter